MQLERIHFGADHPAFRTALLSVSLSLTQLAVAGCSHGEWYSTHYSYISSSIIGSFSIAHIVCFSLPVLSSCVCVCCTVQDISSELQFTLTVLLIVSPHLLHWMPASDLRRPFQVDTHSQFTFLFPPFFARDKIKKEGVWVISLMTY